MPHSISEAKRIVIKVGSSLLVNEQTGALHHPWLATLISDIVECWQRKQQVILVSSGAIALGRKRLQFKNAVLQLAEKQAAAAVGQIKLAHSYQELLARHNISAAQVLLTLEDSENRKRYLNAKNTLETLLALNILPIINENDTIATAEIRYGDNDRLAARVAQMLSADTLVLLSDIEGFYTADPHRDKHARLIPEITELTQDILAMAGESSTSLGSGGMITKLAAAKIALASGCKMVIAAGKYLHPISRIDQTQQKTWFVPNISPTKARKNWLAHHLQIKGSLVIDAGAVTALQQGKSLLSVGIVAIEGTFRKGDAINIVNADKKEIARGLTNYSAQEAQKIMGRKSAEFEAILGYSASDEIIHRDDLVLLELPV